MKLSQPQILGRITRLGNQSYFLKLEAQSLRLQAEALRSQALALEEKRRLFLNERMILLRSVTPVKIIPFRKPPKPKPKKVQSALEEFAQGITDPIMLRQIEKLKGVLG